MKKLRKAIALFVVMIMAVSLMPQAVLAAEFDGTPTYTTELDPYLKGWGKNWSTAELNGTSQFICVTNEIAHSGNNSVVLRHTGEIKDNNAVKLIQENLNITGTYTLSFWSIGLTSGKQILVMQGNDGLYEGVPLIGNGNIQTETDGLWTKYTMEYTVPDGKTQNYILFVTDGETEGWYIDDISIVKSGESTNILQNGSFDEIIPTYTESLDTYFKGWGKNWSTAELNGTTQFICVTNEVAHSGNNSVVLRHTGEIKDNNAVKLIQENLNITGTYTLSFWSIGIKSGKQILVMQGDGLYEGVPLIDNGNIQTETDGLWTKYTMEYTVPEGSTQNYILFVTDGETEGWYIDDISIVKSGESKNLISNGSFEFDGVAEYTDAYDIYFKGWGKNWSTAQLDGTSQFICVTNEISHSGNNSVVLRHTGEIKDNNAVKLIQENLNITGTYTLSFWSIGIKSGKQILVMQGDGLYEGVPLIGNSNIQTETDGLWTKYTMTYTVPSGSTQNYILFVTDGETEGWYIDDISIVKSGESTNILQNGSFDDIIPTYTETLNPYLQSWGKNWSTAQLNGTSQFLCVTNEISHSGNNSVVLRHTGEIKDNNAVKLIQENLNITGTYTLSFWSIGIKSGKQILVMQGDGLYEGVPLIGNSNIQTETDGLWTKYTMTYTVPSGSTQNYILFVTDGETEGWFIDDISIVAEGTTNNLLKNGSFDFDRIAEHTTAYEEYFTAWEQDASGLTTNTTDLFTCVTNEIAHSGNKSVVLRYDASGNSSYLKIKQGNLNLGEGTYTLSFWAAGTVSDADNDPWADHQIVWIPNVGDGWFKVRSMVTDEQDGDWTKYSMEFTVESGETVSELSISTKGEGTTGLYLDDISLVNSSGEELLTNGSFEGLIPEYTDALDAYLYGWGKNWSTAQLNETTQFICVTNELAHSGNNSVVLKHTGELKDNNAVKLIQENLNITGTYTLSFWSIGITSGKQILVMQGDGLYEGVPLIGNSNIQTETDGLWTKYTMTYTVPDGKTQNYILFCTDGETKGWYIDDISIVKSGESNNLISNGSFEFDGVAEYTDAYDIYFKGWGKNWSTAQLDETTQFICVTNEISHSGNNSVVLRHTGEIKDNNAVKLIQENLNLTGTYTLSFWSIGLTSGKQILVMQGDGLYEGVPLIGNGNIQTETDGLWTKYTMEYTVPEGSTQNYILFCTDGETKGWYIDDISIVKSGESTNILQNGSFDEIIPTYTDALDTYLFDWGKNWSTAELNGTSQFICVTNEIAHSGNNSVVLKHTGEIKDNNAVKLIQENLNLTGTYTLSFWSIGLTSGKQILVMQGNDGLYEGVPLIGNGNIQTETDGLWTKYTMTYTVPSGKTQNYILFVTDGETKGWFIDDISIVKQGTTKNILGNGSFEFNGIPEYKTAYEDYFTYWDRNNVVTPDGNLTFSCVTNEIAHDGNYSFVLRHVDSNNNNNMVAAKQTGLDLEVGTYTLTFWAAGTQPGSNKKVVALGGNGWLSQDMQSREAVEKDGIWSKYTLTYQVDYANTFTEISFITNGDTNGWYIDEISLVKVGSSENLLKNGSFEIKANYISNPTVMKVENGNKTEISKLESGQLEISLEVTNRGMGADFAPIMIVALYNGGTLVSMEYMHQISGESERDGFLEDELCFTVDVPEITNETDYKLKVMCWRSWSTLNPLVEAFELRQ